MSLRTRIALIVFVKAPTVTPVAGKIEIFSISLYKDPSGCFLDKTSNFHSSLHNDETDRSPLRKHSTVRNACAMKNEPFKDYMGANNPL